MRQVGKDLSAWGESCRERGRARRAATDAHEEKRQGEQRKSMHNAGGERDGLADEMERIVRVAAITPTKQEMGSTVGREVRLFVFVFFPFSKVLKCRIQLWYCSIHAIHHFSMLRTIAVYELVSSYPSLAVNKRNKKAETMHVESRSSCRIWNGSFDITVPRLGVETASGEKTCQGCAY